MSIKQNPHQLVLRRDTATGLTHVGWDTDLPLGRFAHIELICEQRDNALPTAGSVYHEKYKAALQAANRANSILLQQQIQQNIAKGWYLISPTISAVTQNLKADEVGNCQALAMRMLFQLTRNQRQVWAIKKDDDIVHLRPRQPGKQLDELPYQVWYHQQLHQLSEIEGQRLEGTLHVTASGLWFEPQ